MSRPPPNPSPSPAATKVTRPAPNAPFHPPSDTSTYRDLLLFEERLKMNAEMLRRRRRRYVAFLWSFALALGWLAHRLVFLPPRQNALLFRALQATVAVVFITLALFFASGMYEEKVRYAHSYINHSNKALRPLNMHLNMRRPRPPLLSYLPLPSSLASKPTPPAPSPLGPLRTPSSQTHLGSSTKRVVSQPTVMPQIPPSSNPRGELIFSSRVDKAFREGYERYRAAFERRREEKERAESRARAASRSAWNVWYWRSRGGGADGMSLAKDKERLMLPTPPLSRRGTPPLAMGEGQGRRRSPSPGQSGLRDVARVDGHLGAAQPK